jgi:hypothetical protein
MLKQLMTTVSDRAYDATSPHMRRELEQARVDPDYIPKRKLRPTRFRDAYRLGGSYGTGEREEVWKPPPKPRDRFDWDKMEWVLEDGDNNNAGGCGASNEAEQEQAGGESSVSEVEFSANSGGDGGEASSSSSDDVRSDGSEPEAEMTDVSEDGEGVEAAEDDDPDAWHSSQNVSEDEGPRKREG